MSCQDILAMRKLITQKYDEYEPYLNPFCRMLFCDNWQWPSSTLSQNFQTKSKNLPNKTSLKTDITSWFLSLGTRDKCTYTTIKNPRFLRAFLDIYHKASPNLLYHIYQKREIPDYISKNCEEGIFKKITQRLRIAWLDQPILYFQIEQDQAEGLFLQFINWMDIVSNYKLFEYAHKIKNKNQPQENLLWFTQQSFQQLQAWLINQFEKIIIRNYFNKSDFDIDFYDKISRLKQGTNKKMQYSTGATQFNKKQLQRLLSMKIQDTEHIPIDQFANFQMKVKVYEDHYYEEAALLMDYENSGEVDKEDANKKKKKKNRKKKNKQKSKENEIIGQTSNTNISEPNDYDENPDNKQEQDCVEQVEVEHPEPQIETRNEAEKPASQPECPIEQYVIEAQVEKQQIARENENSLDKISIFEELESSQSISSSEQSDLAQNNKYKVVKTSTGKSHPQFHSNKSQILKVQQTRSLSQQADNNQIISRSSIRTSKGLKKQQKISPKKNVPEKHYNQNYKESVLNYANKRSEQSLVDRQYELTDTFKESSSDHYIKNRNQNEEQSQGNHQNTKQSPQGDKHGKKRKKKNKTLTLQKEFTKKASTALINKQLNQFVDNLSLETNNLYDYKRVAFERVRYFIQSLFPTTQAMLFGSNAVGLSLPTSDIDIMLYNLPCYTKEEAGQILAHLAVQINTMAWIVSCSAYLTAKVPLIKLEIDPSLVFTATKRKCDYIVWPMNIQCLELVQKKQTRNQGIVSQECQKVKEKKQKKGSRGSQGWAEKMNNNNNKIIKVDLSVNMNDEVNLGAQSTELMKMWMARYPQIQRAVIAFKYILVQKNYSSNFKGGIGSYCLFIMIAAFFKQFPELEQLDDGEFLMATLKFYGQQFENHMKSIKLLPLQDNEADYEINEQKQLKKRSCFLTFEQTNSLIISDNRQQSRMFDPHQEQILHHIRENPLKIFDPINNRIMSGSCNMYPQIKADFRRIYRELKELQFHIQNEAEMNLNTVEISKLLQNKKAFDKWLNKYETRSGFNIRNILTYQL